MSGKRASMGQGRRMRPGRRAAAARSTRSGGGAGHRALRVRFRWSADRSRSSGRREARTSRFENSVVSTVPQITLHAEPRGEIATDRQVDQRPGQGRQRDHLDPVDADRYLTGTESTSGSRRPGTVASGATGSRVEPACRSTATGMDRRRSAPGGRWATARRCAAGCHHLTRSARDGRAAVRLATAGITQ